MWPVLYLDATQFRILKDAIYGALRGEAPSDRMIERITGYLADALGED
jgi:hypothetical protein